ncbi:hypothetical protein CK203_029751 [Vitis vinifera]|uniref:Uncharacterized protein n=1 Tax=Vitis vinifera TaxID=29760 RepID=A0A438IIF2_VITVI|nr:hypothetical protein CK203_029751 [Vitis vinifera]
MKKAMMATWSESEESSEEENEKEVANMCFMAIDDLDEGSKKDKWFLDSGCSRHMTGDESKFAFLTKRKGGYVTFGDNSKGRIIGQGNIGLETSMGKLQIEDRRQQEVVEDPKKEESPLALPPPQQVQGESSQDLPKDWKFVINHPQDQIIEFSKCMHSEFEMSMMGELNFFLGLQIKQLKEGTFINQAKYIRDLLKRFNMEEAKTMKTPMSSSIKLDMDEKGKPVNSTMYRGMIGDHRFVGAGNLKALPALHFSHFLLHSLPPFTYLLPEAILGFQLLGAFLSAARLRVCSAHLRALGLRVGGCSFLLLSFSFWPSPSPFFHWMAPRERRALQGSGQAPYEPSQPEQTEARRKGVVTISEPIFPTLVRAFYSRATYGLGGPVLSTVRGVEIRLSPESICRILDIPSLDSECMRPRRGPLCRDSSLERLFRGCADLPIPGDGQTIDSQPNVTSRVLHHMICSILLPRGGHRDEVSYLEALLWTRSSPGDGFTWILMMMHMISCVESTTRVLPTTLPYPSFKDVGVDLSRETDFEAPTSYDTYIPEEEEAEIREMEDGLDPQRDFEQRGPELDIPLHLSQRAFMLRLPSQAYDD